MIAEKWNAALGFEPQKYFSGPVCFEHFGDEHFERKNKSILKPHAVPIITQSSTGSTIEENQNNNAHELNYSVDSTNEVLIANASSAINSSGAIDILGDCTAEHISNCSSSGSSIPTVATVATVATTESQSHLKTQCEECVKKDYLVNKQKLEILHLRKKVKQANEKIWNLEKMKRKLDAAFSELKQQKLLDDELCKSLEV